MSFEVEVISSAQSDLENGVQYYLAINTLLAAKFLSEFHLVLNQLEENPFFQIKYDTIRTIQLQSFPYLVHFSVNEKESRVIILAIVFGKLKKTNFSSRISE
jgi:toxin ParE1/3/4